MIYTVWRSVSYKSLHTLSNLCVTCWLNQANEWSMSYAAMRHMTSSRTHTHNWREARLLGVNVNKAAVCLAAPLSPLFFYDILFLWSRWGKPMRVYINPPPPPHLSTTINTSSSHAISVCLYFNSSPGTSSLLNTFSDIFSDHFYSLGTLESVQLKNSTREKTQKEREEMFLHLPVSHLMNISLLR